MSNRKSANITEEKKHDLKNAQENLKTIIEEIKPFIKKRVLKQESTAGKWRDTSNSY